KVAADEGKITIDGYEMKRVSSRDPASLPWGELGVDLVLECTGAFTDRAGASKHLSAGAKKVLISAPCKGGEADATIVMGVNDEKYDRKKHSIVSIGSCTTNSLAPMAKVLDDSFGIESGFMTTCHAYTNDQLVLDANHKDFRRARAGAVNIIPTSTGAAKAIGEVIPKLKGKMDGLALRVPIPVGSITDLSSTLSKAATKEEINAAFKKAAEGKMKGIMEYTEEPIVSSDIVHNPASAIIDGLSTLTIGKTAKTFSWYDNEWGFSNRMVEMATKMF
ncbi:MAG: type I glyceraldehyde-3-phosphate dehydrogenase, partial [Candidatus Anstonellaceae archaeon]